MRYKKERKKNEKEKKSSPSKLTSASGRNSRKDFTRHRVYWPVGIFCDQSQARKLPQSEWYLQRDVSDLNSANISHK